MGVVPSVFVNRLEWYYVACDASIGQKSAARTAICASRFFLHRASVGTHFACSLQQQRKQQIPTTQEFLAAHPAGLACGSRGCWAAPPLQACARGVSVTWLAEPRWPTCKHVWKKRRNWSQALTKPMLPLSSGFHASWKLPLGSCTRSAPRCVCGSRPGHPLQLASHLSAVCLHAGHQGQHLQHPHRVPRCMSD